MSCGSSVETRRNIRPMKRKSTRTNGPAAAAKPQAAPVPVPPSAAATAGEEEAAPQEPIHVPPHLKGRLAERMLAPEMGAAQSIQQMMDDSMNEAGIDLLTVAGVLKNQGTTAAEGDLAQARRTLSAQIAMLDRTCLYLFNCAMRAQNRSQDLFERYMRLALKAQAQSAHTTAVLGRLSQIAARAEKAAEPKPKAGVVPQAAAPRPAPFSRPLSLKHRLRPAGTGRTHGLSAPKC